MSFGHPALGLAQDSSETMGCEGPNSFGSASPAEQVGTRFLEREDRVNSIGLPVDSS